MVMVVCNGWVCGCGLIQNLNRWQMMNNSNGFQGGSLLGSSTGFKKRPLLRPPSGMLSKKQQFLRSVDVSQSEPLLATSLRSEIAAIEEEINLMDKDRRLRQGDGGLQKSYVTVLRRWLRQGQGLGEKEDDDMKVLKHMGVDSYQSGFRKLWKVVGHLDLAITKITELQIVNFLIYDEMFEDIGKDSPRSAGLLSQICNNGYSASTFQITQILLERMKDVYGASRKGSGKGPEGRGEERKREDTGELIAQLKAENAKLNSMLEQLVQEKEQKSKQVERERQKPTEKQQSKSSTSLPDNDSLKIAFKQMDEKYQQQMRYLTAEKSRAQQSVADLRTKINGLQTQLKVLVDATAVGQVPAAKAGTYEQALMEEMDKMKRGFERKIVVLTEEYTGRERELRKKELEYKSENEKIKWEKSLLLKKFEVISK